MKLQHLKKKTWPMVCTSPPVTRRLTWHSTDKILLFLKISKIKCLFLVYFVILYSNITDVFFLRMVRADFEEKNDVAFHNHTGSLGSMLIWLLKHIGMFFENLCAIIIRPYFIQFKIFGIDVSWVLLLVSISIFFSI